MAARKKTELTFEAGLEQLEALVTALEQGSQSLETSLDMFEQGTALCTKLQAMLDQSEQRLTVLQQTPGGQIEVARQGLREDAL